jgi:DNA/RNA endonuclease YhcR with UshA esterase domain
MERPEMRSRNITALIFILFPLTAHAGCIQFSEAGKHVGETRCVTGKVLRVEHAEQGLTRLNFCEPLRKCQFTAVVFAEDSKKVGELNQFQGKTVEIRGPLKSYDGVTEIILQKSKQVVSEDRFDEGPSLLQAYDVEEKGHYSAGTARAPKSKRTTTKKQPATLPIGVPMDAESSEGP